MMQSFLKCDAEGCGHREEVGDILEEQIGMPCPKCGANLLTKEDFDFYDKLVRPTKAVMSALEKLVPPGAETEKVTVSGHQRELSVKFGGGEE